MVEITRRHYGGYMKDVPPDAQRRWPADTSTRRKVRVSIARYSIGTHYWTRLSEESNPFIVSDTEHPGTSVYQECWDDYTEETKGKSFDKQCATIGEAAHFIRKMVEQHFPESTHEVEYSEGVKNYFLYGHDGD